MSFSYSPVATDPVSIVRMLVADTSDEFIPLKGTCNTNGTAFTALTGSIDATSPRIVIGNVEYIIAMFIDNAHATLATSAGVQTGVAWTSTRAIFDDSEINRALFLESSQGLYTSGPQWPNGTQAVLPIQVYSYYRAGAVLLRSLAGNKALLSSVTQILDVQLGPEKAAQELRATAKDWCETEANRGSFAVAEIVQNAFGARQRQINQILRFSQ